MASADHDEQVNLDLAETPRQDLDSDHLEVTASRPDLPLPESIQSSVHPVDYKPEIRDRDQRIGEHQTEPSRMGMTLFEAREGNLEAEIPFTPLPDLADWTSWRSTSPPSGKNQIFLPGCIGDLFVDKATSTRLHVTGLALECSDSRSGELLGHELGGLAEAGPVGEIRKIPDGELWF